MAFGARDICVLSLKRIGGGGMFGYPKLRRFEAFHRMTRLAGATVFARTELSTMRIRGVAIGTPVMGQGLTKSLSVMTISALHSRVFAG